MDGETHLNQCWYGKWHRLLLQGFWYQM